MNLCIIIVTWNAKNFLKNCLISIFKNIKKISFEIIVVDNGSIDGTSEMIKREFPEVILIQNSENLGFAKANNQALKYAIRKFRKVPYVLLLNSDVIIKNNVIEEMFSYMEAHSEVGCISPALILPDKKSQVGVAGFNPSPFTGFNYFFFISKLLPKKTKGLFIDQTKFLSEKRPVDVDWVSGACLMVRKKVILEAGLLNEDFFFYVDDVDWCIRIKEKGWKIHYLPWLSVIHYHNITFEEILRKPNTRWVIELFQYIKRRKGYLSYVLFRLFFIGGYTLRIILYGIGYFITKKSYHKQKAFEVFYYWKAGLKGKEI